MNDLYRGQNNGARLLRKCRHSRYFDKYPMSVSCRRRRKMETYIIFIILGNPPISYLYIIPSTRGTFSLISLCVKFTTEEHTTESLRPYTYKIKLCNEITVIIYYYVSILYIIIRRAALRVRPRVYCGVIDFITQDVLIQQQIIPNTLYTTTIL